MITFKDRNGITPLTLAGLEVKSSSLEYVMPEMLQLQIQESVNGIFQTVSASSVILHYIH